MDIEIEEFDKQNNGIILNNENNYMISNYKQEINEEKITVIGEQLKKKENLSKSNQKMNIEKQRICDQNLKMMDENEQIIQDNNKPYIIDIINIQEYLDQIYKSSSKKAQRQIMKAEIDQYTQLLESLHIRDGSKDCESEQNKSYEQLTNLM